MDNSKEKAQQSQLLPALQPRVQPRWESAVLGAVIKLVRSCQEPRQVHQGQQSNGDYRQGFVHNLNRNLVKVTLLVSGIRMYHISDKGIKEEKRGQAYGHDHWSPPESKQSQG